MKSIYQNYTLKKQARALYISAITPTSGDPTWTPSYQATLGLHDLDADALLDIQSEGIARIAGIPTGEEKLPIVTGEVFADRSLTKAKLYARNNPDKAEIILASAAKRAELFGSFKSVLACSSSFAAQDKFNGRYATLKPEIQERVDKQEFVVAVHNKAMTPSTVLLTNQAALDEHADKFYWGCYVGGSFLLEFYGADRKKKRETDGLKIYPRQLGWTGHGDRLGATSAPIDYSAYDTEAF